MKLSSSTSPRRAGFTLVEIMIVVSIIALLAAIAVPSFMRARKRSMATSTLNTLRIVDDAKAQYAMENGKKDSDAASCDDLLKYVKQGTRLYNDMAANHITDAYGRDVAMNALGEAPAITHATWDDFATVIEDPVAFFAPFGQY